MSTAPLVAQPARTCQTPACTGDALPLPHAADFCAACWDRIDQQEDEKERRKAFYARHDAPVTPVRRNRPLRGGLDH